MTGLVLEHLLRAEQIVLQGQHSLPRFEAGAQFADVEGLGEEIVGPGVQRFDHVRRSVLRREENHVHVSTGVLPNGLAHRYPIDARHDPIHDGEGRRVRPRQRLNRLRSIFDLHHVVAKVQQGGPQHPARNKVVIRDQDVHVDSARVNCIQDFERRGGLMPE